MGDNRPLLSSSSGVAGNGVHVRPEDIPTGKQDVPSKTSVLERIVPWEGYQRVGLVDSNDFKLISEYDRKGITDAERNALLEKDGVAYAQLFIKFVTMTSVPETLQYILTLIHELLTADPKRVELFNAPSIVATSETLPYEPFRKLISKGQYDAYTTKMAAAILGILVSKSNSVPRDIEAALFRSVSEQLRQFAQPNSDVQTALVTLQVLLSKEAYRIKVFEETEDFHTLVKIIQTQSANFQLVYDAIYCVWLMTYTEKIASRVGDTGLIPALVNVIKTVSKEKVVRLAIATLRNVVDKEENNNEMIDAGLVRMLAILSNKKWGDEDIVDDLKTLSEALAKNMVVLSSFDMYKKELASGQLTWSPVHKSEKFWRENATRFEENDYYMIRLLGNIFQTSEDPLVLSVACYDVGEFARFHPRGKGILTERGIKPKIMNLLTHANPEVKKQAIFAMQKTMVTNWEYLAKGK